MRPPLEDAAARLARLASTGLVEDRLAAIANDMAGILKGLALLGFHPGMADDLHAYTDAAIAALHTAQHDPAALREPDSLDEAMFNVWLLANWRFITSKMTSEAREAAVNAVLRYDRQAKINDPDDLLTRASLAWWED